MSRTPFRPERKWDSFSWPAKQVELMDERNNRTGTVRLQQKKRQIQKSDQKGKNLETG